MLDEGILTECTRDEDMVPVNPVHPTELWLVGDHSNPPTGPMPLLLGLGGEGVFDALGHRLTVTWFPESWPPTIDPLEEGQLGDADFMELSVERAGGR